MRTVQRLRLAAGERRNPPRALGLPTKLDDVLADRLVDLLGSGTTDTAAAAEARRQPAHGSELAGPRLVAAAQERVERGSCASGRLIACPLTLQAAE